MRILMILDNEFPPDIRVEKEALSLIKFGYEVIILCRTSKRKLFYEEYKSIKIYRFQINKILRNKLEGLYLILPFYRKIWEFQINKILKIHKIDILHIHDLPLCGVGAKIKKKNGCLLICDQHEYYSDWIVHTETYNKFPGNIVKIFSKWKKYEKDCLLQSDLVITIEKPLKQIYIDEVGIDSNKIVCVPNTPLKSIFNDKNVQKTIVDKYKEHFVIFYAGGLDTLRGIDIIIESLKLIQQTISNIKFVFAGKIYKGYNPIKHAEKLGVTNLIEFVGFIPVNEIPSYIAASDVCVFIPPVNRDEINKTIATKIYQFLTMKKPIIVSQAKLMKDFIISNKLGLALDDYSKENFTEMVLKLYNNLNLRKEISQHAEIILENYYWEKTIKSFLNKIISFEVKKN